MVAVATKPLAAPPKSKNKVGGPGLALLEGPIAWGRVVAGTVVILTLLLGGLAVMRGKRRVVLPTAI